jgi:hypothetical protein
MTLQISRCSSCMRPLLTLVEQLLDVVQRVGVHIDCDSDGVGLWCMGRPRMSSTTGRARRVAMTAEIAVHSTVWLCVYVKYAWTRPMDCYARV